MLSISSAKEKFQVNYATKINYKKKTHAKNTNKQLSNRGTGGNLAETAGGHNTQAIEEKQF